MKYRIYLVVNTVNDKKYIGITTKDVQTRWKEHLKAARLDSPFAIHRAIRKHGEEVFVVSILEETNDKTREIALIEEHDTRAWGYNLTDGGDGTLGLTHSEEAKQKIGASLKGKTAGDKHYMWGKSLSAETKEKLSSSLKGKNTWLKGRPQSEEVVRARALRQTGEGNPMFGRKHSEETKQKMRDAKARRKMV